jgi:hypothetical protein
VRVDLGEPKMLEKTYKNLKKSKKQHKNMI